MTQAPDARDRECILTRKATPQTLAMALRKAEPVNFVLNMPEKKLELRASGVM